MKWHHCAADLAASFLHPQSRWREPVTEAPRHLLVPRWFTWDAESFTWDLRDGPSDEQAWLAAAYADQTLVTRLGPVHADQAEPGTPYPQQPTSSSTLPQLAVDMYRAARIYDGADVLDIGTGSGYGCALLARRLGAEHVTSIDVDPYLTGTAAERLSAIGLKPDIRTADATRELPGSYDRIVPMVSLPAIPPSWLAALRPGGRLVFSLTGGSVLITADKTPDGGAAGKVEHYHASFMAARHGADYPARLDDLPAEMRDGTGEHVSTSRYPVVDPTWGWEIDSMLSVVAPGITYQAEADEQTGVATVRLWHQDGSWARASGRDDEPAIAHQSGPRRLWDILDDIRHHWVTDGCLPLRGARAQIDPDGTCHLTTGSWHATIHGTPADLQPAG